MHQKKIKVIPWTVNEKKDMKKMIEMGVDVIITDYPNYIEGVISWKNNLNWVFEKKMNQKDIGNLLGKNGYPLLY